MRITYNYSYIGWVKKTTLFVVIFTLVSMAAFSQSGAATAISGTVTLTGNSADIAGTTVQVKGKTIAVTTDAKGHYSITAQRSATLVFSHVGFQSVERTVTGATEINVTLDVTVNNL